MNDTKSISGAQRAVLAVVLCMAISMHVAAQVPQEQAEPVPPELIPPAQSGAEAAQLEEEQIDRFADAYIAVEEIHTKVAEELSATDDPETASEVRAKAEGSIIDVVERSGLELDEFNRIAELMTVDRDLRLKIADRVRERRRI